LRQVPLAGLDNIVHFDKAFVSYAEEPDGRVRLYFEDGSSAACDLLVGADGVSSCIRKQFLPGAQPIDTGVIGIAGKLMLTDENRTKAPPSVLHGTGLVMASARCSMFLALQEFGDRVHPTAGAIGGHDEAYALEPGSLFDNTTSYVMWAYGGYRADIEMESKLAVLKGEGAEGAGASPHCSLASGFPDNGAAFGSRLVQRAQDQNLSARRPVGDEARDTHW
jgi:hypothetical protein